MLLRLPVLLFAIWAALLGPVYAADPVFPKGLQIGLAPPGDMKLSAGTPGFEDPDRKASISILQLPLGAYEEIERAIFSRNQEGLVHIKRENFPFQNGIGILVSGRQEQNGTTVHKWFLAATGPSPQFGDITMLIKVDVPDAAKAVYSDATIRDALKSVTFRPAPLQEQLSQLPFSVNDLSGFRVLRVIANQGLILIDGDSEDMIKHPYVLVSVGTGAPEAPDTRGRFAAELLSTAPLRNIAVTFAEPQRINGYPGFEIRATATGLDGKPLMLVQWLRFAGAGFIRTVGVVHKEDWDKLFPRFREVRDGIEPK
ncbi:MAG TPA: hypothetical protein VEJ40_01760 [Pseudolabrys sp.]|nr:hypothetical protein [Pseudolabrys sp.]